MNLFTRLHQGLLSACGRTFRLSFALLGLALAAHAGGKGPASKWNLPEAADVTLRGAWGEAYDRGVKRLDLPPYDSPAYLRSDFSFETNRIFVNYSGDISGRFIQIASLVSPPGEAMPPALAAVLRDFIKYQRADGHFGREVDWNQPLEPESSNAVLLPIFWGNARLLTGLLEAYRAFRREDCLAAAKRIGDFYIATSGRFLDFRAFRLHTLKRYLLAESQEGVFVNFLVDAAAPLRKANGRWKVSVAAAPTTADTFEARIRIDPLENAAQVPGVFVRRPWWVSAVTIRDRQGRAMQAREEQGYLRLSLTPGVEGEASITFTAVPRVENRRMH